MFSPRERRCFLKELCSKSYEQVFSARAEVFLTRTLILKRRMGFLRASGGVSRCDAQPFGLYEFSPRERRCFLPHGWMQNGDKVFSARAEVFPSFGEGGRHQQCFLRASGGVSNSKNANAISALFSPRERRCFRVPRVPRELQAVFSARAEVFLLQLL